MRIKNNLVIKFNSIKKMYLIMVEFIMFYKKIKKSNIKKKIKILNKTRIV